MKRTSYISLLAVIAALYGCGTDIETESRRTAIVPAVVPAGSTKAADGAPGLVQVASYQLDGSGLYLNVYEGSSAPVPATRGSAVTVAGLTEFSMKAYAYGQWYDNTVPAGQQGSMERPNQPGLYFDGVTAEKTGGAWTMSPVQYWLNGADGSLSIRFWSWKGSAEPEASLPFHTASFTGYTVAASVPLQEDLIYAYNAESRRFDGGGNILDGKDEKANIHFYHALSEISFDVSEVGEDLYVSNIALNNVYGKGDCSMHETAGADGTRLYFDWTNLSSQATYSQSFSASDFDASGALAAGSVKKMYLIPQDLTQGTAVTMTVTFSPREGGEAATPVTRSISTDGSAAVEWKAGKYYRYRISKSSVDADLTVSVDPEDWIEGVGVGPSVEI